MAVQRINGKLANRLSLLEQYVSDLRELPDVTFAEYQTRKHFRRGVERLLHLAIEACLDIGRRLSAQAGFRQPQDNKDVFTVLVEAEVLPPQQLTRLHQMAGFRNILVHQYADLDNLAVYGAFKKRLSDFDAFAEAIADYLSIVR